MSNIRAVIFDMDGVLIDAKDWHYECLNKALEVFGMPISRAEHLSVYDGLTTATKLEMLSKSRRLPRELHQFINALKQKHTQVAIANYCHPNFAHEYALSRLSSAGYRLAVASNSIRQTVNSMMESARLTRYLDFTLCNEDVSKPKPDSEIYDTAINKLGLQAEEVVIVEDNEHGIAAARASGAHVLVVKSVDDVNYSNISEFIRSVEAR